MIRLSEDRPCIPMATRKRAMFVAASLVDGKSIMDAQKNSKIVSHLVDSIAVVPHDEGLLLLAIILSWPHQD